MVKLAIDAKEGYVSAPIVDVSTATFDYYFTINFLIKHPSLSSNILIILLYFFHFKGNLFSSQELFL